MAGQLQALSPDFPITTNRELDLRCRVLKGAKQGNLVGVGYLEDVLARMSNGHPVRRLDDLLPWNWRPTMAAGSLPGP